MISIADQTFIEVLDEANPDNPIGFLLVSSLKKVKLVTTRTLLVSQEVIPRDRFFMFRSLGKELLWGNGEKKKKKRTFLKDILQKRGEDTYQLFLKFLPPKVSD